ncbi:MAG: radical SAM protein [Bacilli bacterium]|jgi:radical SAM protein with 4Fe4S-binding SPASM domain|nr:radical SAM protein [Bacilli bacterium]HHU24880.1 radical SAM protein [Acholeplasmataceae bacterium]
MNKQFKMIYVEITNRCNLDCPFCTPFSLPPKEVTLEEFNTIVQKVKPFTNHLYLHLKGEPLCHSKFPGILEIAQKEGVKINITTNGTLLAKYKSVLFNSPALHRLNVSLQSLIAQTPTQKASYLPNLSSFLKEHTKFPKFILSLRLWNDLAKPQVQKLNNEVIAFLNKELGLNLNPEQLPKTLGEKLYLSKEPEFKWPSLTNAINPLQSSCLGGKTQLGILADGSVVLCCLDCSGNTTLGNIFSTNLASILKEPAYTLALQGFRDRKAYFELCQKCEYRNRFLE